MTDTAKLTSNGEAVIPLAFFTGINLFTGDAAGQAPNVDFALLNKTIEAAKKAVKTGSQKSDHALQKVCEAVALPIEHHSEELAQLINVAQGNPLIGLPYKPLGVIGSITPWKDPLPMAMWHL